MTEPIKRILGIDPGTNCGWAVLEDGKVLASGCWDLKPRRHEGGGMRFVKFRGSLLQVINSYGPFAAVGYEEVRRHAGTDAAHVYGGIVAVLSEALEGLSLPYLGVPVGTVKKLATGKGNADKEMMVEAAAKILGRAPEDDNEADAIFVALAAASEIGF
jgi:Holliday junction resolvasome RuvABC endonuclease subunit